MNYANHQLQDHGQYHEEEEEFDLRSRHSCTDVFCCLLFFAALSAFALLWMWSTAHGNVGKLFHGIDYHGQICGISPNVSQQPYLYWCPLSMDQGVLDLNLQKPICVTSCPGARQGPGQASALYGTQPECEVVSGPEGISSYRTRIFLGRYCLPHAGNGEYRAMARQITRGRLKDWRHAAIDALSSIPAAWPVLIGSFFISILLGYVYLAMLRHCAEPLIFISMLLSVLGLCVLGGLLWSHASEFSAGDLEERAGTAISEDLEGNEGTVAKVLAGVCWASAFGVVCLACCFRHSIAAASACVEVACDAIFEMPSLLLAPIFKAVFKGFLCGVLLYGFLLLYSTGTVTESTHDGISRSLEFEPYQYYMALYYMVLAFWILAFVNALYQFVVAFAVAEYYYTPYDHDDEKDVGCCVLWTGLHVGVFCHTGSLAFGALLIALLQTFQKIIEYAEHKNEETANSQVIKCILCCCACCVHCCKDIVQFVNKNAYIDIAVTSHNFCDAARQALEMIVELGGAMAILNGATFVFTVFGAAVITLASGAFTYVAATHGMAAEDSSLAGVSSPIAPMAISMVMGFLVALDFMNVFDMTSDTLLYCYGIDLHSGKGGYTAPPALKELVHSGEHGGDPRRH